MRFHGVASMPDCVWTNVLRRFDLVRLRENTRIVSRNSGRYIKSSLRRSASNNGR